MSQPLLVQAKTKGGPTYPNNQHGALPQTPVQIKWRMCDALYSHWNYWLMQMLGNFFPPPPPPPPPPKKKKKPTPPPKHKKKHNDNRKSYNIQLSNLVEVTPFYGIGLSSKLDRFLHTEFSVLCWAVNIGKILKEEETFWQNKLESEANSEASNLIRSWKRKQKIPIEWKRKQTRKHDTSRGAGSGSKKYSTASTFFEITMYWSQSPTASGL